MYMDSVCPGILVNVYGDCDPEVDMHNIGKGHIRWSKRVKNFIKRYFDHSWFFEGFIHS